MGLINCPECGKKISDQAPTCPGCGMKIKKKKPIWVIVIAAICGLIAVFVLFSAVKDLISAVGSAKEEVYETSNDAKKETKSASREFVAATNEELGTLPDQDGLISSVGKGSELEKIWSMIGVTGLDKDVVIGNYRENEGVYNIDVKCTTSDDKVLLIGLMYIDIATFSNSKWEIISNNSEWNITSISDYNSGDLYYVPEELRDAYDIYDYKTGELISRATKSPEDVTKEAEKSLGIE